MTLEVFLVNWKKRFAELEEERNEAAEQKVKALSKEYDEAIKTVEREIGAFYLRYAKDGKITFAEAKQILTSGELKSFRTTLTKLIEQTDDPKWKQTLERLNLRQRVSRMEMLLVLLQNEIERLAYLQEETIKTLAEEDYTEQYYHALFLLQSGLGVGVKVESVPQAVIKKLITEAWAMDEMTFADRIKTVANKHKKELEKVLIQGFNRNDNLNEIAKTVVNRFEVSQSNARRLVVTEHSYFVSSATKDSFKLMGVDKYEIVATLDLRTSQICRDMDGKVFPLSEYRVGVTAHPFHPWCRTMEVPYFKDIEDGQRIARNKFGENIHVPQEMKYQEWHEKFIEK